MTFAATILTLYPDMFPGPLGHSLAGRALAEGTWSLDMIQHFNADKAFLGADFLDARAGLTTSSIAAATLGRNLISALELFADVVLRPHLDDDEVEPIRALAMQNLRSLDLTRTAVTSAGIARLAPLMRLERINLTQTAVDGPGVEAARRLPAMPRVWAFEGP